MATDQKTRVVPRIIIHGGAGNITRENFPPEREKAYREALLAIVKDANELLQKHGSTALDVATYAVSMLENHPFFNSGRGACFTRAGTNELEASIMVSRGSRKRGVGVMTLHRVKNPIKLAREMLLRGELTNGGGAQTHCQVAGAEMEMLAEEWGLEMVRPSYFMTRRLWDQHRRALEKSNNDEEWQEALKRADESAQSGLKGYDADELKHDIYVEGASWRPDEYITQGTCGCVVLDSTGTICAATSTGGITNKLPGRIGDTPTLGAGFWCEEWIQPTTTRAADKSLLQTVSSLMSSCYSRFSGYERAGDDNPSFKPQMRRAVGMSGTGSGDSFLRVNAVRTAAAMARYASTADHKVSLAQAVAAVAGPNGILQQSAGEYWHQTGEGEGGIIGIEFDEQAEGLKSDIVFNFNCGGLFRAWIDAHGVANAQIFK